MKGNMAPLDRGLRCGLGTFLILTPLLELNTFPYNLLGIIPLATALAGVCPLYSVFGIKRRAASEPAHAQTG